MPKEDRRLIFDYEEVYKAVYAFCAQKQVKKPPPGRISTVREDAKDSGKIYMELENPQDKGEANTMLEYSRDFLAAALMIFCRGHGIPLPKNAQKSVLIEENNVVLRVQL